MALAEEARGGGEGAWFLLGFSVFEVSPFFVRTPPPVGDAPWQLSMRSTPTCSNKPSMFWAGGKQSVSGFFPQILKSGGPTIVPEEYPFEFQQPDKAVTRARDKIRRVDLPCERVKDGRVVSEKGEVKHVLRVVEGREARVGVEFEPGVEARRGTEIGDAARGLARFGWG